MFYELRDDKQCILPVVFVDVLSAFGFKKKIFQAIEVLMPVGRQLTGFENKIEAVVEVIKEALFLDVPANGYCQLFIDGFAMP
jgi:hypothetical protein